MGSESNGRPCTLQAERPNVFAPLIYLPEPLGRFPDELPRELRPLRLRTQSVTRARILAAGLKPSLEPTQKSRWNMRFTVDSTIQKINLIQATVQRQAFCIQISHYSNGSSIS